METRANYALIGAFVLMIAAAVIGFALWLGSTQFNRDNQAYDIVFPGPVTLEEGAAVRYIGIKVGEVQSVAIDRRDASQVRARIIVDRTTPVKTDSTAAIELAGITGVTFVQINAGSNSAPPLTLKPGQDVPVIEAEPNPLTQLFASGEALASRAGQIMEQTGSLLADENIAALNSALKSTDSILQTLAEQDAALLGDALSTMQNLQQAGTDISSAARMTTELGQVTQAEMVQLSRDVQALLVEVNKASIEAQNALREGSLALASSRELIERDAALTLNETRIAAEELQILIERLDRLAREVEQNPSSFVLGNPLPYEKENRR